MPSSLLHVCLLFTASTVLYRLVAGISHHQVSSPHAKPFCLHHVTVQHPPSTNHWCVGLWIRLYNIIYCKLAYNCQLYQQALWLHSRQSSHIYRLDIDHDAKVSCHRWKNGDLCLKELYSAICHFRFPLHEKCQHQQSKQDVNSKLLLNQSAWWKLALLRVLHKYNQLYLQI